MNHKPAKNIHQHLAIVCEQEEDSDSGICSLAVGANLAFPKSIGFISCIHLARNPQKAESGWVGRKYWNVTGQNSFIYCTQVDRSDFVTSSFCQGYYVLEASYWPKRVSLAVIYCREITEVSMKPDGDRERPSVSFSEYEKCYPVLIETCCYCCSCSARSHFLYFFFFFWGF